MAVQGSGLHKPSASERGNSAQFSNWAFFPLGRQIEMSIVNGRHWPKISPHRLHPSSAESRVDIGRSQSRHLSIQNVIKTPAVEARSWAPRFAICRSTFVDPDSGHSSFGQRSESANSFGHRSPNAPTPGQRRTRGRCAHAPHGRRLPGTHCPGGVTMAPNHHDPGRSSTGSRSSRTPRDVARPTLPHRSSDGLGADALTPLMIAEYPGALPGRHPSWQTQKCTPWPSLSMALVPVQHQGLTTTTPEIEIHKCHNISCSEWEVCRSAFEDSPEIPLSRSRLKPLRSC